MTFLSSIKHFLRLMAVRVPFLHHELLIHFAPPLFVPKFIRLFLDSPPQTQRLALEHTKISEEPTSRISIWRRPPRHFALVDVVMVAHRLEAAERGNGVSSSEYKVEFYSNNESESSFTIKIIASDKMLPLNGRKF